MIFEGIQFSKTPTRYVIQDNQLIRSVLEAAGFEPSNVNVCVACYHEGGEHNTWNRCLIEGCDCLCFCSMRESEKWDYAINHLAEIVGKIKAP